MRRIFPLKAGSALNSVNDDRSENMAYSESSRQKISSSRDLAEGPRRPSLRGRTSESVPAEDVGSISSRYRREHWCPSCSGVANELRCETPPSGDENLVAKEEDKVIITPLNETGGITNRASLERGTEKHANSLPDGAQQNVIVVLKGTKSSLATKDIALKRRIERATGEVDGRTYEKGTKPPSRNKNSQIPSRPTSAPKVRPPSRNVYNEALRLHSMRVSSIPDRVFDSRGESVDYDSVSSSDRSTPCRRPPQDRPKSLASSRSHSRSSSFTDSVGTSASFRSSDKPPVNPPSVNSRKSTDLPSKAREACLPDSSANPVKTQPKPSSARSVAERFAKAFRSGSKISSKDSKSQSEDRFVQPEAGFTGRSTLHSLDKADSSFEARLGNLAAQSRNENASIANIRSAVHSKKAQSKSLRTEMQATTWNEFAADPNLLQSRSDASVDSGSVDETVFTDVNTATPQSNPENADCHSVIENRSSQPQFESKLADDEHGSDPLVEDRRQRLQSGSDILVDAKEIDSVMEDRGPRSNFGTAAPHEEKEKEILRVWLEALKRQSEYSNVDDLEGKAKVAEERVSIYEQQLHVDERVGILHGQPINIGENGQSDLAVGISIMQQRIRRMHEDKKRLALEVAAEIKRRITERETAKEILIMMKREMEACVKMTEKEKLEMQSSLERELERREKDWSLKLDKIRFEERRLRDRALNLEEEKSSLQREFNLVASRENALREKVREFELQMDGHRKRVEGAEKTILELRQSLVNSCQQARQAEDDLETVKKAYLEKEGECQDLRCLVERLQQLCVDQEKIIHDVKQGLKAEIPLASPEDRDGRATDLQDELARLRELESVMQKEGDTLREEASILRLESKILREKLVTYQNMDAGSVKSDQDLQIELKHLQSQSAKLQDENNGLSSQLRHAVIERDSGREAFKSLETNLLGIEEEKRLLRDEVDKGRSKLQEKERELQKLERRLEVLSEKNSTLQTMLTMREKAAMATKEEVKDRDRATRDAQQSEAEMRDTLQASARQVYLMNHRVDVISERLLERDSQVIDARNECLKKDESVRALEQSVGDMAKTLDTQNRRILQLSSRNEELFRLYHVKGKELEDLHTRIIEEAAKRKQCKQDLEELAEQARECKRELEAQDLHCRLLREKLVQREEELHNQSEELATLIQNRDWMQIELKRIQGLHTDANLRVSGLEKSLKEKEEFVSMRQRGYEQQLNELTHLREKLPRVQQERDELHEEAEEMGREALRLSAEVEVLRRKVVQLDEDVMFKEGQISILRGSCFTVNE